MRITTASLIIGIFVALLGLIGILSGDGQLMDGMNIDLLLDVVRLALGGYLIYAGTKSEDMSKNALVIFGALYLGMFVIGLLDPTMLGTLPSELGPIDQTLHLFGGIAGLVLPFMAKGHERVAAR